MAKRKLEDDLIKSLTQATEHKKGQRKLHSRTHELPPPAPAFSRRQVKAIRNKMNVTQEEFAIFLNVGVETVRSWEQGKRNPSAASCRLLEIYAKEPFILKKLANS